MALQISTDAPPDLTGPLNGARTAAAYLLDSPASGRAAPPVPREAADSPLLSSVA